MNQTDEAVARAIVHDLLADEGMTEAPITDVRRDFLVHLAMKLVRATRGLKA